MWVSLTLNIKPEPLMSFLHKTTHHQQFPPKPKPRFLLYAQTQSTTTTVTSGCGENGGSKMNDKDEKIKWGDLVFDPEPDPDNVIAVALTGLLTWASVQVLWQLFFISLAIFVAALKYCCISALLAFILITLF